jgi:hypothetical protein
VTACGKTIKVATTTYTCALELSRPGLHRCDRPVWPVGKDAPRPCGIRWKGRRWWKRG